MTGETILGTVCNKCGNSFNKGEEGSDEKKLLCTRCVIELAEQSIAEKAKTQKPERKNMPKVWVALRLIILLASIFIIAIRAPKLVSVIKEQKPIRNGTYATDSKTNLCIKNLWHISRMLQEGKLPEKDIICPVSKMPYVLRTTEADTVVTCPNPELHGLKEIRVSKIYPCPRVIK